MRQALPGLVLLLSALAPGSPAGVDAELPIHPAVRLVVNARGDLLFEVKAAPGDGWSHLATRFAASAEDWRALERLNGGGSPGRDRFYRVPYALLRPEYRFLGIAALFPEDWVDGDGWHHRVGSARLAIEDESLYRLAFWLTGDGENFRAILEANRLDDPSLATGHEILVPAALLRAEFRARRGRPPSLIYAEDGRGPYAGYRLRHGEALYTAVVQRFTGRLGKDEVNAAVRSITDRSGIDDVTDIPAGFLVRIPLEVLSEEHLPAGDPRRVELEMSRLLASRYRTSVHSRDLAGITVILDPGHGGIDIGTRKNGVWEDDTVYDISIRLRAKLRERTAASVRLTVLDQSQKLTPHPGRFRSIDRDEVVLTDPHHPPRDSASRAVGVNLRAFLASSIHRAARKNGHDDEKTLFISIHADALHPSVRGAMVYVPGERFRRGRYGASGPTYNRYREVREKPYVSFSRSQRLRSEGLSRKFAETIVLAFRRQELAVHPEQPIRDHVVRKGRSWVPAVLRGNEVPIKVLVEVANIGNSRDARLLTTPEQRDRMAQALFEAIVAFYRGRERLEVS